jgi:hypothetical protein
VENAPWDYYWGCGATGEGRNRLGEMLMELRAQFMQEAATTVARYGDDLPAPLPSVLADSGPNNVIIPAPLPASDLTPAASPAAGHTLTKAAEAA